MASRNLPGLGLNGFWNLGEDGWNTGMDENLRVLSAVAQGAALSRTTALPGSPTDGDIYIVPTGSGSESNKLALRDDGAWVYLTPQQGWVIYIIDAAEFRYWTGASWVLLSAGGGASAAGDVTYDGGSGGPSNVQDALDVLFSNPGGGSDDQTAAEVPYDGGSGGPSNVQDALDVLFNAAPPPASGWVKLYEWVHSVDGDLSVVAAGAPGQSFSVAGYSDVMIQKIGVTASLGTPGIRIIVSDDGGTSWFTSSGNYVSFSTGGPTNQMAFYTVNGSTNAAVIECLQGNPVMTTPANNTGQPSMMFVGSANAVDALGLYAGSATTLNGGRITIWGRA